MKKFNKFLLCAVLFLTATTMGLSQPKSTGVEIAVKATPTATLGGYYHICAGETDTIPVYLTNGPVWDITFYDGFSQWTVTGITTSPYRLEVTPPNTRTYTILDVYNGQCHNVGTGAATVIIDAAPIAWTISCDSNTFCQGRISAPIMQNGSTLGDMYQLLLNGSPVGGIMMGTGGTLSWPGQSLPGTYTVRAANPTGCTSMMNGSINLIMNPLPANAGTINGPVTACEGSTASYTTGSILNATNYVWSVPMGSTIISGQGTTTVNVQFGSVSGNISVFGTNDCGGGQPSILAVSINTAPTLDITSSNNPICVGESTDLTANGNGVSFLWSPGGMTTRTITVSPLMTTTYTVVATGANGCSTTGTYVVDVNTPPNVTLSLTPDHSCTDDDPITPAGGSPAGGSYTGGCILNGKIYSGISGPGTWTITYTYVDPITGCSGSSTDLFTINPIPMVNFYNINGPIYTDTPPFDLTPYVNPIGGTFSGPGVLGTMFNPAGAGPGTHMITYDYTHPITGCSASQIQYIPVAPTGIDEIKLAVDKINIYMTGNILHLSGIDTKKLSTLEIINSFGHVVYNNTKIESDNMQINFPSDPGMYIVMFIDTNGKFVGKKFIKI